MACGIQQGSCVRSANQSGVRIICEKITFKPTPSSIFIKDDGATEPKKQEWILNIKNPSKKLTLMNLNKAFKKWGKEYKFTVDIFTTYDNDYDNSIMKTLVPLRTNEQLCNLPQIATSYYSINNIIDNSKTQLPISRLQTTDGSNTYNVKNTKSNNRSTKALSMSNNVNNQNNNNKKSQKEIDKEMQRILIQRDKNGKLLTVLNKLEMTKEQQAWLDKQNRSIRVKAIEQDVAPS